MTPEELQKIIDQSIKEAHSMGLQSGKKETSGLVDLVIHKLETTLEPLIDRYVNGKINKLLIMQEAQNKVLDNLQIQIKTIQTDTTPLVDDRKVITGVGKFVLWLGGIVITIAGVFKLVK